MCSWMFRSLAKHSFQVQCDLPAHFSKAWSPNVLTKFIFQSARPSGTLFGQNVPWKQLLCGYRNFVLHWATGNLTCLTTCNVRTVQTERFKCHQSHQCHQCHLETLSLKLAKLLRTCNDLHQNRGHLIRPTETFHRKLESLSLCAAPKSCGCTYVPWCTSIYYANAQKGYSTYVLLCARQQFSYKKQNGRFKKKKSRSSRTLGIG